MYGYRLSSLRRTLYLGRCFFDERVFQQQRFQLRFGGNNFDVGDFAAQALCLNGIDVFVEVGTDAIAQIDRFAHVDNFVVFIFM